MSCAASSMAPRRLRGDRAERAHRVSTRLRPGSCQHLARQGQIDRSPRLAHGDVERAVDDRFHRLAGAQLVIPLHVFAQHAALIEGLLAPMDGPVARGDAAGLGERGAAGGEQQRNIVAGGIDQAVDRIRGADGDMHHHCGRFTGNAVIAVRHGHGDVLVRDRHEARGLRTLCPGQRLHDRGEIRSGIGEYVFDTARAEPGNIGFGRHAVGGLGVGHDHIHPGEVTQRVQGDGPPRFCQ